MDQTDVYYDIPVLKNIPPPRFIDLEKKIFTGNLFNISAKEMYQLEPMTNYKNNNLLLFIFFLLIILIFFYLFQKK